MNPSKFIIAAAMACLLVSGSVVAHDVDSKNEAGNQESEIQPAESEAPVSTESRGLGGKLIGHFFKSKGTTEATGQAEGEKKAGIISKIKEKIHQMKENKRSKRSAGDLSATIQKQVKEAINFANQDAEKQIIENLKLRNPNEATKKIIHETLEHAMVHNDVGKTAIDHGWNFASKMNDRGLASVIPSQIRKEVTNKLETAINEAIFDLKESADYRAAVRGA